ncbi:MAG: hypothetical protein F6K36_28620 [Symploca sp. SIO3C6]|nr:hypothetical protein [Symploca sp. SIO3C6]NET08615.1 hypothetical protein [Symploca sp. SIO2B6]NET47455.1 hypothetical protein [Merismopedia sp. SIO2A8]
MNITTAQALTLEEFLYQETIISYVPYIYGKNTKKKAGDMSYLDHHSKRG